jgi:hypothetical protein
MADNVFINGRAAIHKGSAGKSIAFPDVCLCPPGPPAGPIPTPLVNTAQATDLQGGALTVTIEGNPIAHNESYIAKSTGNEVARGTGGGVISHQVQGRAYFQTFSMNVFIEGKPAVRHLDLVTHNHLTKIPGNTPPTPWMSAMTAGPGPAAAAAEQDARQGRDWIEFVLVDPDGEPLGAARLRLEMPDGTCRDIQLPVGARFRLRGIKKGSYRLVARSFGDRERWRLRAHPRQDRRRPLADKAQADAGSSQKRTTRGELREKGLLLESGTAHRVVVGPRMKKVRMQLHDGVFHACRSVRYRIDLPSGETIKGKTNATGWLFCEVPADVEKCTIAYGPDTGTHEEHTLELDLREVPDGSEESCRVALKHLGFEQTGADGSSALLRFQALAGVEPTNRLDGRTQSALAAACDDRDQSVERTLG